VVLVTAFQDACTASYPLISLSTANRVSREDIGNISWMVYDAHFGSDEPTWNSIDDIYPVGTDENLVARIWESVGSILTFNRALGVLYYEGYDEVNLWGTDYLPELRQLWEVWAVQSRFFHTGAEAEQWYEDWKNACIQLQSVAVGISGQQD